MLRIRIDRPYPVSRKAELVLSILAEGIGLPVAFVDSGEACDVLYSPHRPADDSLVWLPATDREWEDCRTEVSTTPEGVFVGDRIVGQTSAGIAFDLVCASWLVLTGSYEKGQNRNRFGVPVARGSFAFENGLTRRPVVADYTKLLQTALNRRFGSRLSPVERWPGGATSAIVLSHDLDRPFSRPTAEHYHNRIVRDARAGDIRSTARSLGAFVKNVLLQGDSAKQSARDPNFGFRGWEEFERSIGTKSAFYVAVRSSDMVGSRWEEVNYRFTNPVILNELLHLAAEGWEIGLHASIACRDDPSLFAEERVALAAALGQEVRGLRHHYWALDPISPEETLKAHAAAGFEYDSSLGFNDAPGFRRGMAWPFNPIDPSTLSPIDALQLPPTVMDAAVFSDTPSTDSEDVLRRHIETVRSVGGALVLNWHVEQQNPDRLSGAGPALMRILSELHDDDSIFWASPVQLKDWWTERRQRIDLMRP